MKKTYVYFIPAADAELLRWLNNFKEQIAIVGPGLGLTPVQISDLQDKAQQAIDALLGVIIKKQEYNEAVLLKNQKRSEEVSYIANAAVMLKRNPLFTNNIGGALGIIGPVSVQNRVTFQPFIKVASFPGYVEVAFNKRGQSGVTVFSRIRGTENWVALDKAERSPYKDTRPLAVTDVAEIREYKVLCLSNDASVGQYSEIGVAAFGG